MALYIVLELAMVATWAGYGHVASTRAATMDPKKLARFRTSSRLAAGLAVLIAVRLVTHTYG